jgi:hypothetical protein
VYADGSAEVTDSMKKGEIDILKTGAVLGINKIIYSEINYEGDTGSIIQFGLGAERVDFEFGNRNRVDINLESIEDASVELEYSASQGRFNLYSITYTLDFDSEQRSEAYLQTGDMLSKYMDEPEGLLGDLDLQFNGQRNADEDFLLTIGNYEYSQPRVYEYTYAQEPSPPPSPPGVNSSEDIPPPSSPTDSNADDSPDPGNLPEVNFE